MAQDGDSTHVGSGGAVSEQQQRRTSSRLVVDAASASRAATTATWHGWRRPVRPRVDHGGGTRLVNDGVVEQRGVPGRLRTTASVHQLTGVS